MTYLHSVRVVNEGRGSQEHHGGISLRQDNNPLVEIEINYTDIQVEIDKADKALWCFLQPQTRPSFTEAMLHDLNRMQRLIGEAFTSQPSETNAPLQYLVVASRTPGVFNLGGDLRLFSQLIRARDDRALRHYARSCVGAVYLNSVGYDHDLITIGLAQGDALGGGWECLLSCDMVVAERRARFSLPEVLFNLFPGMGAHSFLTRRVGAAAAERIIMSGKVYAAEDLHTMGLVDVLAEDGAGERTVREWIGRNRPRHNAHAAIHKARRRVNPVSLTELRDVADIWVDAALRLQESDLRRMAHLAAAQDRSRRRAAAVAVAAE